MLWKLYKQQYNRGEQKKVNDNARIIGNIREYSKHFQVVPCLTFTPPELGIVSTINSPPREPSSYANFVHDVCRELGDCFTVLELSNEWNLKTDWNRKLDPEYQIFSTMI